MHTTIPPSIRVTKCKIPAVAALMLFSISAALPASGEGAPKLVTAGAPIWASASVQNEPLLFIEENGVATAELLFTPAVGLRITHPDLLSAYHADRDYIWRQGSKRVTLTVSSRIPFKTAGQMLPPKGSPNMFGAVLHSEGHYFHDLQVQATYTTAEKWQGPVPVAETDKLKKTIAKLKAKQPVSLVALGDSITAGLNASGMKDVNTPPYQPGYPLLVANTLQERFGVAVSILNLGQSGSVSSAALSLLDKVAKEKPDVVMVAYGMNHGESGDEHEKRMAIVLEGVKRAVPNAEVVLVASMSGNPIMFPLARFEAYRDALKKLEGPGVAVADVTSVWAELMKHKKFHELSGNNVNHPNDFTHRIYAQVIVQLFGP